MNPVGNGFKEMDPVQDGMKNMDPVGDGIIELWIQQKIGLKK